MNEMESYDNKEYDLDEQMEHALDEMMQMSTPILDLVAWVCCLPAKLYLHPIFVGSMAMVALSALFDKGSGVIQELAGIYLPAIGLALAGKGTTGAMRHFEKEAVEDPVRKKLLKIFQDEELFIHSYSRGGSIPEYLINHSQLMHDYNGSAGGDLITLHYRGYAVTCCNVALTQPRTHVLDQNASSSEEDETEAYIDQYKEDDIEAAERYSIKEGQDVVFYGSVFIFIPGPDIKGHVILEAAEPIEYLRNLKSMDKTDILTNPGWSQDKEDFFRTFHRIREESKGDIKESDRVLTQRVKDMVLQLELRMRAPVGVYADKNMVCLTIQKKAFDFDNMHTIIDLNAETVLENTLIEKVNRFRKILDIMLGPERDEYTELFGTLAEQRSSVYLPLLNPAHPQTIPNDEEIEAYIDDLVQYSLDMYRFFLQYSMNFHRERSYSKALGKWFLFRFYSFEDQEQMAEVIKSDSGNEFINSLTRIISDYFRELWSAPGKSSVKTISRIKNGNNTETIKIEISIYPPVRAWNYKEGTELLAALMREQAEARFDYFEKLVYNTEEQRSFFEIFKEKLGIAYHLRYDVEHIYTITMTLLDNDRYGFTSEEWNNFCTWYLDLLKSHMTINGKEFSL